MGSQPWGEGGGGDPVGGDEREVVCLDRLPTMVVGKASAAVVTRQSLLARD